MTTILYPEAMYPDDAEERRIFGPDVTILRRDTRALADLTDADCAEVDGLMLFRQFCSDADLARFPRLRAIVRMGVGYDRIDRAAAAARGVTVCNVPDYGTTEVADHAMALVLALRRGIVLHHEWQRHDPPEPWRGADHPLLRRASTQGFGIVGMGRIGTAVALRAKAFGFRVTIYDPHLPNGAELAVGVARAPTLHDLMRVSDVLSIHTPLTPDTTDMIDRAALARLPPGAVVVNTARGPVLDVDALADALREDRIAGAGLDVLPVEPPVEPVPELLRAYRAREPWVEGRLIITPHSAYLTPEAHWDIRVKSAETMRAALLTNHPQNVIPPGSF
ncbi:MAG: C-terminal binding protein [Janthinobacterium lividum]